MSKMFLLAVLLAVVAAGAEEEVKAFMCYGFYGCDSCCSSLASGCKKTSDMWFPKYMEVCRCTCPRGTSYPQRSDITNLEDLLKS